MPDITITEVTKHYRQGDCVVRALDGVSLRIRQGEFVAVVGRSGSGKTTLLDVIGLLLTPTSGSMRFDDEETTQLNDGKRARARNELGQRGARWWQRRAPRWQAPRAGATTTRRGPPRSPPWRRS